MAEQCKRIRSAVIDGRAQTLRYIQKQLTQLHDVLRKHQKSIHDAICRDSDWTSAEADSEIYLALKALRNEYEAIDFAQVLKQEYSIAHAKENVSRRCAVGCVYIIPGQHSRFYSVIQPVATAIAAGNCVMVEVSLLNPPLRSSNESSDTP
jgi:acyl-CoA reductase-like NAD-dependent aldehyde dehydrogenase